MELEVAFESPDGIDQPPSFIETIGRCAMYDITKPVINLGARRYRIPTVQGVTIVEQSSPVNEIGRLSFDPIIHRRDGPLEVRYPVAVIDREEEMLIKNLLHERPGERSSISLVSRRAIVGAFEILFDQTKYTPYALRIIDIGILAINYAKREVPD